MSETLLEALRRYCGALRAWSAAVPAGFREMHRGERVLVPARHVSGLSSSAGENTYVEGEFMCATTEAVDVGFECRGHFRLFGRRSTPRTCCCESLGRPLGACGSALDLREARFTAPVGRCFPHDGLLSEDNIPDIKEGVVLLLGTACSPLLSTYRVVHVQMELGKVSGVTVQHSSAVGDETSLVSISLRALLGSGDIRALLAGPAESCVGLPDVSFTYSPSFPTIIFAEIAVFLQDANKDKMDPHEGFESEIRTLVTFLCDCVSIGVAKICEEAAILQASFDPQLCGGSSTVENGSLRHRTYAGSPPRSHVTTAPSRMLFTFMQKRRRNTRLSDMLRDCMRIACDLCTFCTTPVLCLQCVRDAQSAGPPSADGACENDSRELLSSYHAPTRLQFGNTAPAVCLERPEIKAAVAGLLTSLMSNLLNGAVGTLLTILRNNFHLMDSSSTTRRRWCGDHVSILKLRHAIHALSDSLDALSPHQEIFQMVKVNLITLEATIDSCLEGRLNRAIQHILFGAFDSAIDDVCRQDWESTAPFRRGRKLSYGIIVSSLQMREVSYDAMDAVRNTCGLSFPTYLSGARFILSLSLKAIKEILLRCLQVFRGIECSRFRLEQLHADLRAVVLLALSEYFEFKKCAENIFIGGNKLFDSLAAETEHTLVSSIVYVFLKTCPAVEVLQVLNAASNRTIEVDNDATEGGLGICGIHNKNIKLSDAVEVEYRCLKGSFADLNRPGSYIDYWINNIEGRSTLHDFKYLDLSTRRISNADRGENTTPLDRIWTAEFMLRHVIVNVAMTTTWVVSSIMQRFEMVEGIQSGFPKLNSEQISNHHSFLRFINNIDTGGSRTSPPGTSSCVCWE